jgi:hypothetical protein
MGLLESLKLPNTLLDADPGSVLLMKEYSAEGISFTPDKPMKRWYVSFNGKMRCLITPRQNSNQSCRFQSTKEPRQAFQRQTGRRMDVGLLQRAHQTHYEQMGYFTGTLTVENKSYRLKMDAFRDHSFGESGKTRFNNKTIDLGYKRDWT